MGMVQPAQQAPLLAQQAPLLAQQAPPLAQQAPPLAQQVPGCQGLTVIASLALPAHWKWLLRALPQAGVGASALSLYSASPLFTTWSAPLLCTGLTSCCASSDPASCCATGLLPACCGQAAAMRQSSSCAPVNTFASLGLNSLRGTAAPGGWPRQCKDVVLR